MRTHIIEATNKNQNWGKFLLGVLDDEWDRFPETPGCNTGVPLLASLPRTRGQKWDRARDVLIMDLQTREAAVFALEGDPRVELERHQVWVCPLFEPFLGWLYSQPVDRVLSLDLPAWIDIPDAKFAWAGHRRSGAEPIAEKREITHALYQGKTLCGMPAPSTWPPGHKWTHREDVVNITCEGCKATRTLLQGSVT